MKARGKQGKECLKKYRKMERPWRNGTGKGGAYCHETTAEREKERESAKE